MSFWGPCSYSHFHHHCGRGNFFMSPGGQMATSALSFLGGWADSQNGGMGFGLLGSTLMGAAGGPWGMSNALSGYTFGNLTGTMSNINKQMASYSMPTSIMYQSQPIIFQSGAPIIQYGQATAPTTYPTLPESVQQETSGRPEFVIKGSEEQMQDPSAFATSKNNNENYKNGFDTQFEFGKGKTVESTEAEKVQYTKDVEALAEKHIASNDQGNNDGKLDLDEFKAMERKRMDALDPEALKNKDLEATMNKRWETMFNNLNTRSSKEDGDKAYLDKKEIAAYYAYLDNVGDGKNDGKFTFYDTLDSADRLQEENARDITEKGPLTNKGVMDLWFKDLYGQDS